MTVTFFVLWVAIFAVDTAIVAGLGWAVRSERYGGYRIRTGNNPIAEGRRTTGIVLGYLLPPLIYVAFFVLLGERTLYAEVPRLVVLFGETLGVLLLYDFMYYFFHRTLHRPALMRSIHGMHHKIRYATAEASTFVHPAETVGGVGLFLLAIVLVGPISTTSFLLDFFLFSAINIYVHSNLVLPHPAFRLFNFWTRSHDVHHYTGRDNYASIFPFWDQAFGTAK